MTLMLSTALIQDSLASKIRCFQPGMTEDCTDKSRIVRKLIRADPQGNCVRMIEKHNVPSGKAEDRQLL